MNRKILLSLLLCAALLFAPACAPRQEAAAPAPTENTINGTQLAEYTVVYSEVELDFNRNAAEYVSERIAAISGVTLPVKLDTEAPESDCEILVGQTNRAAVVIDTALGDYEFLIRAYDRRIALYGDEYMVAGAAYAFVTQNFTGPFSEVTIPGEGIVSSPVFTEAKNIILLIGDGMGFNSLAMGEYFSETVPKHLVKAFSLSSLPQVAVANRLPYQGQNATRSADNDVTDSAAGGTALATGYKTNNYMVGLAPDGTVIKNLCELAQEKGRKTAVLTTDLPTGATPSAFSAHALSRDLSEEIEAQQAATFLDVFTADILDYVEEPIRTALSEISGTENGFFMMYEEAHIDKYAHSSNETGVFSAYARLNRALRVFNEFLLYHPDTMLILTADHETGGIQWDEATQSYIFTSHGTHTGVNVPLFAIGAGTEIFDGKIYDNTFIPKFIARQMGEESFGDPDQSELLGEIPEDVVNDGAAA